MVITKYVLILLSSFFFVFFCLCLEVTTKCVIVFFCEGDGDAISTRNVGKSKVHVHEKRNITARFLSSRRA